VKVEIDEELWYGASSDEVAEAQAAKSMAARMGRIVGAKPFPAAAHRLSVITQDPNCQMDEVVQVLESDPALSARLLRLVNSVGFSLRTACTSVRHAAALVGTEKLNQVASTAAILDMYESGGDRARELLEHATVVGTLCRYLAFHFGLPPDELFTCGFLHDIGKLMLLDTEGADYLEVLGSELPDFDKTYVEERKRYGFDHALLAGHVLAAWNIPHPVPKVVAWHHHVTRAYAESTAISQMVSTLRLADAMSFALSKPDAQAEIENIARMEAASYMDISEGQLAAMWDEVRALTERARAVFRGEKVEDQPLIVHTSRPSGASLRAVARARNSMRGPSNPASPSLSGPARQFPCVACGAPSFAHRCSACQGYMCPRHISKEDEWCQLCQRDYEEAGIPAIRPLVSTLFGALAGGLVAAAFFGAASAGAQRPLRIMLGPTLILMLLGMLAGVGQRWVRRWWFLRNRPNRASIVPKAVEAVLGSAVQQNPQILEIEEVSPGESSVLDADLVRIPIDLPVAKSPAEQLRLLNPEFPGPPALPQLDRAPAMSLSRQSASSQRASSQSAPSQSASSQSEPAQSEPAQSEPAQSEPAQSVPPPSAPPQSSVSEGTPPPRSAPPRSRPPRSTPPRERTWMSSRTPLPTAVSEKLAAAPSEVPPEPSSPPRASEDAALSALDSGADARAVPASEERPVEAEHAEESQQEPELAVAAGQAGGGSRPRSGSVRPPPSEMRPSSSASRSDRGGRSRPSSPPRVSSERPVARIRPSSSAPSSARTRSITPAATPSAHARLASQNADALRTRRRDEPPASSPAAAAPASSLPPARDAMPASSEVPAARSELAPMPEQRRPRVEPREAAHPQSRPVESRAPESQAAESQAAESRAPESQAIESQAIESQVPQNDTGAPPPRPDWTSLLDEGAAGGW
jgi:HD-like signal output (HDOD) protein